MLQIFQKKDIVYPDFRYLVKAANRAKIAYLNPDEINKLWEDKDNVFDNAIECPVYITKNEASAYFWRENTIANTNGDKLANIIFRGTNSIQDVIDDLDMCLISVENKGGRIKVHEGFYRQFISIEPYITKLIQDENITSLQIFAHSLGAGIGQIAAAFYGEKNIEVSIYTIGCPRTGNDKFVKWFTKNVKKNTRIVNQYDPVPTIPIWPTWVHTNDGFEIKNNNFISCPKEKWGISRWIRPITTIISNINYKSPIKGHTCIDYIANLSKLCKVGI
jgi:hypothetical protein